MDGFGWKGISSTAVLFLLWGASSAPAAGQVHVTGGRIVGIVSDQSGGRITGTVVTATRLETNVTRQATTDERGEYGLVALEPGTYRVRGTSPGFSLAEPLDVVVTVGQTVAVDMVLPLAGLQVNVAVTAASALVDVRRSEISSIVTERQIRTLPLNRRNFIGLAILNPGVAPDSTPMQGISLTSGLSVNGQRGRSNTILVDGFDNNVRATGGVRGLFGQDAIREYRVLTTSATAEFGNAAGGVISIVTQSGTNEFRGGGSFFFRNDAFNAREHFERFDPAGTPIAREKAPFRQRQWSVSAGGPLAKDRAFGFASVERADLRPSTFVGIDQRTAALLNSRGFPVAGGHVPYVDETWQTMARLDQVWTPRNRLTVRANHADGRNEHVEPIGGLVAKSNGVAQLSTTWAIAASHTDSLSNRWHNELRVQSSLLDIDNRALDPACVRGCLDDADGGPVVEVVGLAVAGRSRIAPALQRERRTQVANTISYSNGRHTFKAGFDLSHIAGTSSLPLHFGGRYIFSALPAVPALGLLAPISAEQALALDLPAAYVQGYGDSRIDLPSQELALFTQDEWLIGPKVALNVGVRYQRQLWPDRELRTNGLASSFRIPSDSNNVAPRLAVAFDPTGRGRTVIHAAYGIFYDRSPSSIVGIPSLVDGSRGVRTMVLPFPQSVAAWRAPGRRLPEPAAFPSLQFALDPRFRTPSAHQASVGFDRELWSGVAASVTFVDVRGREQVGAIDYNPTVPALGPGRRPLDIDGRAGTSASVIQYTSYGRTWSRSLTVGVRRRFAGRGQFEGGYVWSNTEDTTTDFQSAFIPEVNGTGRRSPTDTGLPAGFDADAERGPSANERPHRFVANGLWLMPWDVQVSGILTMSSGRPFTILAGVDLNGDGNGGGFPPDRARANPSDPATSLPRNSGRLPAQATLDLRLSRRLRLHGPASLELILETYNLLNRTNFTEINAVFGPGPFPGSPLPTYGQFTSAGAARQMQLGIRVDW